MEIENSYGVWVCKGLQVVRDKDKRKVKAGGYFASKTTLKAQPSLKSVFKSKRQLGMAMGTHGDGDMPPAPIPQSRVPIPHEDSDSHRYPQVSIKKKSKKR